MLFLIDEAPEAWQVWLFLLPAFSFYAASSFFLMYLPFFILTLIHCPEIPDVSHYFLVTVQYLTVTFSVHYSTFF